jgi:hypothetical protein
MSALEDRVITLEVKMNDVKMAIVDLKAAIVALDTKMDRRFDGLDERFERRFLWLLGAQLTTLFALIAGMFGVITKLL